MNKISWNLIIYRIVDKIIIYLLEQYNLLFLNIPHILKNIFN